MRLDFSRPETLPGRRVEAWRYSDLRAAVRTPLPPSPPGDAAALPIDMFVGLTEHEVVYLNGRPVGGAGEGAGVVRLRFVSQASGTAHRAEHTIAVAAGERVVLLESHEGVGEEFAAEARLTLMLGEGAAVERIVVLDGPDSTVSVATCDVRLAAGASFAQTTLVGGGKLQRSETRVAHPGAGASVRLDGVYALGGRRHGDVTSVVTHGGEGGATSQLTKGVVAGAARSVFQGKIVVEKGADGTDARMGHHALILSERAEVDAKPELEIYADDVSCAHGNTVGALDEVALFYAMARGVPEDEARIMLTEAFLGEVIDRIEHAGAREAARAWLAGQLAELT